MSQFVLQTEIDFLCFVVQDVRCSLRASVARVKIFEH